MLLDFVRWVNMNYIQAFMLALLKKESYMHLQAQHEEQERENVTTLHLLHAAYRTIYLTASQKINQIPNSNFQYNKNLIKNIN